MSDTCIVARMTTADTGNLPVLAGTPVPPAMLDRALAGTAAADPYMVYLARLDSDNSKRTMAGCLDRIALIVLQEATGTAPPPGSDLPPMSGLGVGRAWWLIRYEHAVWIRAHLIAAGLAPATVNKHLAALRGVLKQCRALRLMSVDDYAPVKEDLDGVKGTREPARRYIGDDEFAAMLTSAATLTYRQGQPQVNMRLRDTALLMLLWATAVRAEESATALIERWDARERKLVVLGKGNKEAPVWLHPKAAWSLGQWLGVLGERDGPIFRGINKADRIQPGPITGTGVYRIVERHQKRAGIPPCSPHDLRATRISNLWETGADGGKVRKLARHESIETTMGYDVREERGLREISDSVPIPTPPGYTEIPEGARP